MKVFDISWQVSEPEYRADSALSYSTLAKFAREGFNKLDNLFDRVETPSLTFGSAVDALITGGQEEFENSFMVADFPSLSDSVLKIVNALFSKYHIIHRTIREIADADIITLTEELKYQLNWKPETRAKVIKEQGEVYYSLLYSAGNRKILDITTNEQVLAAVRVLKESDTTKFYFAPNSIFDENIVREYQLKFKATLEGIDYRCMSDLLITDHKSKTIYPIDLKTSSHTEWEFFDSFVQWQYHIQARLYWRIIRDTLNKSEYFKDYELADYKFIVVNKKTLTPLIWKFKDTQTFGTLTYGDKDQYKFQDPYELGKQLSYYLSSRPKVPQGININESNDIIKWLNK